MRLRPVDGFLYLWMRALKALDKRKTGMEAFSPGAVRNILIVSSTAIGDTLLSTPAIRAVRKRYPRARIVAMFNRDNMELFESNPHINGVVPYYGGYRRFFRTAKELRAFSFDLALIFHGNEPQATPLCYLSGAPFIFKLPNDGPYNFLLSNSTPVVGWGEMGHGIEGRLKAAALAGCVPDGLRMEVNRDKADEEAVSAFLSGEGVAGGDVLVGFQAGASTVSRQWFADRFVELGKRLIKRTPRLKVVLTGSPGEARLCKGIADGIGRGALLTAGRLRLRQTPSLIGRLKALVTGDTGPMHMAIAVNTPVVALYAVADPERTGPLYDRERHIVIRKPRTCDPCLSKRCGYQKCMEAISVDEVEAAVRRILEAAR
ncbi:MAG: glycosyltransferase family 9 protein [Deltaproteobacteria bacterium]|nr:glycosyltransferase family 9 protein [Deltaproteobacteria bacterium]